MHHSFVVQTRNQVSELPLDFTIFYQLMFMSNHLSSRGEKKINVRDCDMNNRIREFINIHDVAWHPA